MDVKKLGVLGGMGPFATSVFLERIIKNTEAMKDQDHIDIVILNHATIPDRTEAILTNNGQPFLDKVEEDIRLLEFGKVDNIAIPCNTSHYYFEQIQQMTDIHIINMVKSTVQYVKENFRVNSKVAVLATDGTKKSRVYEDELVKQGLEPCQLSDEIQKNVMEIIYAFKSDALYKTDQLDHIISHLVHEAGCASVILACTELSCIPVKQNLHPFVIDALDILVKESILLSGKKLSTDQNLLLPTR